MVSSRKSSLSTSPGRHVSLGQLFQQTQHTVTTALLTHLPLWFSKYLLSGSPMWSQCSPTSSTWRLATQQYSWRRLRAKATLLRLQCGQQSAPSWSVCTSCAAMGCGMSPLSPSGLLTPMACSLWTTPTSCPSIASSAPAPYGRRFKPAPPSGRCFSRLHGVV